MTRAKKPMVLFVDDEIESLEAFTSLMRSNGLDVIEASDLTTALDAIKHETIDLLLCDIRLNTSNTNDRAGVQIAEFASKTQPGVPIVANTAFFVPDDFSKYEKSLFTKVYAKGS